MTSNEYTQFPQNDSEYYNPYTQSSGNAANEDGSQPLHAPSPQRPGRTAELLTPGQAYARSRSSSAQRYTPVQYQQQTSEYTGSPLNPFRPQFQHHAASYASQPPPELHYPPPRRQNSHPSKYHRRDCTCDCECCYYDSEPEFESTSAAEARRRKRRSSRQPSTSSRQSSQRRRHSSTDKMEKSKPLSKKDVIKNYVFGTPIKNY